MDLRFVAAAGLLGVVVSVVACGDDSVDGQGGKGGDGGAPSTTKSTSATSGSTTSQSGSTTSQSGSTTSQSGSTSDASTGTGTSTGTGSTSTSTGSGSTVTSTGSGSTVTSTGSSMTSSVTSSGPTASSSTGMLVSCDDIGVCAGDGMTPDSGCLECAIIGDMTTAQDGGTCFDEYDQCFGTTGFCADAGNPDCCNLYDCFNSCDFDMDGTIESGNELDCACSNDGMACDGQLTPGTCLGDYQAGINDAVAYSDCITVNVCLASCGGP